MKSLYGHEQTIHNCARFSDEELVNTADELSKLRDETVVPRQLAVIARLLAYLDYEQGARIDESVELMI